MSGLGYGIGSFMEGLASGIRSGQAIASRNRSEALDERRLQLLEEEARRKADDDAYNRSLTEKKLKWTEEDRAKEKADSERLLQEHIEDRSKKQADDARLLKEHDVDRARTQELWKREDADRAANAPLVDATRKATLLKTENELKSAKTEADIRGMGELAKADYEGQRSKAILMSKDASGKTVYTVDGETTDSKEDAEKLYEQHHGSFMDNYYKVQAPKIMDAYIANGQPEKAEQFRKFLEADQGRKTVEIGGRIMQSYLLGDMDGVNKHINQLVRGGKYMVTDGYDVKAEPLKDKDGATIGLRGVFKNKQTGESFSHDYAGDGLTEMISGLSNPSVLFEQGIQSAERARAVAAEERKKGLDTGADIMKKDAELENPAVLKKQIYEKMSETGELKKIVGDRTEPMTPEEIGAAVNARYNAIYGKGAGRSIMPPGGGVRPTTLMPQPVR